MNKALLILSTLSLSIIAAGSVERSYQDGMLGQVLTAPATTERSYSLVQNVKEADGWHAYVRDYGMTLEGCTAAMHGMRSTGCEVEG